MQLAILQDDPLGLVIEAQIAMLDGQYQLAVETAEAINRLSVETMTALRATQPLTAEQTRDAVAQGTAQAVSPFASNLARRLGTRNVLLACGLGIVLVASGVGLDRIIRSDLPVAIGIDGGPYQCEVKPGGWKLCQQPIWVPPEAAQPGRKP